MATTTVYDDYRERGERRHNPDSKEPPGPAPSLDSYNYDSRQRRLTISGQPPAHTRHASEGSPPPRPTLFLGRGGGFKRPQLPRQPSTRRRRASDETGNHHQQQQQGLFDSFRRLSLDQQKLQEQEEEQAGDFYNYQEVFQQMKNENPAESLGALQQLTIARIAELKAQRQQEEQLQLEEQQRREEEERLRNQTLAKKYVDKWVGKINPLQSASDGHAATNPQHHATGRDDMLTHFIPTGSRPSVMRFNSRRISVESSTPTVHSSLAESAGRSNENNLYVNAGEDQAGNMAPRKSVGDLSSMHDPDFDFLDDKSVKSVHSHFSTVSGLFVDAESVMTSGSRLSDGMSKVSGSRGAGDNASESGAEENGSQRTTESNDASVVDVVEAALSKCTTSFDEVLDIMESMSHARSEFSDSANFSRASSSGLIVGFPSKDEEDTGLIVGFGDRSRRREKQEEREEREGKAVEKERMGLKDASQRSDPIVW